MLRVIPAVDADSNHARCKSLTLSLSRRNGGRHRRVSAPHLAYRENESYHKWMAIVAREPLSVKGKSTTRFEIKISPRKFKFINSRDGRASALSVQKPTQTTDVEIRI